MSAQPVCDVLSAEGITPILVDIGASGGTPEIWHALKSISCYVGFEPDAREVAATYGGTFQRSVIIDKAVSWEQAPSLHFYLTSSPFCSSALKPNLSALADYWFHDLFQIVRETDVPAQTLTAALADQGLTRIDWLKVDAQGADLRIYKSIPAAVRDQMLALDMEPGLLDAYEGEDLFPEVHRTLRSEGFWLSDLQLRGTVRVAKSTVQHLRQHDAGLLAALDPQSHRSSPGWCELRYLRSLPWLRDTGAGAPAYALLWAFSMVDRQYGYALDVARALREGVEPSLGARLEGRTRTVLRSARARRLPRPVARVIRGALRRLRSVAS
jgi:hypothetical protein